MSFPIEIHRGAKPSLRFANAGELNRWIDAELAAWQWLGDAGNWDAPLKMGNGSLRGKVAEVLLSPLTELQGLTSEGEPLSEPTIDTMKSVLDRAYREGPLPTRDDAGAANILAAAKDDAGYALGMLAQALAIPVINESAAAFAGRQGWIAKLPGALAAGIDERLETLRRSFAKAEEELGNRQMATATKQVLNELTKARRTSTSWVLGLAVAALIWVGLAVWGISCIHRMTLSVSAQPEWGPEVAERAALFLFLMTVFSWGMRWIGRMIQDAWAAGQSAARRYTALKVVLDDTAARLVKGTEKDWDRVRAEIFGDGEASTPAKDKAIEKEKDADGDQLDVAKKVVALLKDMQALVPGAGKS